MISAMRKLNGVWTRSSDHGRCLDQNINSARVAQGPYGVLDFRVGVGADMYCRDKGGQFDRHRNAPIIHGEKLVRVEAPPSHSPHLPLANVLEIFVSDEVEADLQVRS